MFSALTMTGFRDGLATVLDKTGLIRTHEAVGSVGAKLKLLAPNARLSPVGAGHAFVRSQMDAWAQSVGRIEASGGAMLGSAFAAKTAAGRFVFSASHVFDQARNGAVEILYAVFDDIHPLIKLPLRVSAGTYGLDWARFDVENWPPSLAPLEASATTLGKGEVVVLIGQSLASPTDRLVYAGVTTGDLTPEGLSKYNVTSSSGCSGAPVIGIDGTVRTIHSGRGELVSLQPMKYVNVGTDITRIP